MSLEIGLAGSQFEPFSAAENMVSLDGDENGGYYWFLRPLLDQLAEKTGQSIDLLEDAEGTVVTSCQLVTNKHDKLAACRYESAAELCRPTEKLKWYPNVCLSCPLQTHDTIDWGGR